MRKAWSQLVKYIKLQMSDKKQQERKVCGTFWEMRFQGPEAENVQAQRNSTCCLSLMEIDELRAPFLNLCWKHEDAMFWEWTVSQLEWETPGAPPFPFGTIPPPVDEILMLSTLRLFLFSSTWCRLSMGSKGLSTGFARIHFARPKTGHSCRCGIWSVCWHSVTHRFCFRKMAWDFKRFHSKVNQHGIILFASGCDQLPLEISSWGDRQNTLSPKHMLRHQWSKHFIFCIF